jgi:5-bromo-4-chloroindolyl phosphate hydrolysis protein
MKKIYKIQLTKKNYNYLRNKLKENKEFKNLSEVLDKIILKELIKLRLRKNDLTIDKYCDNL